MNDNDIEPLIQYLLGHLQNRRKICSDNKTHDPEKNQLRSLPVRIVQFSNVVE